MSEDGKAAKAQVRGKFRNAYAVFVVTGDHGDKASAVIRLDNANNSRRCERRDLSSKFVYDGIPLSFEQEEAEVKAWISAASLLTQ